MSDARKTQQVFQFQDDEGNVEEITLAEVKGAIGAAQRIVAGEAPWDSVLGARSPRLQSFLLGALVFSALEAAVESLPEDQRDLGRDKMLFGLESTLHALRFIRDGAEPPNPVSN